MKKTVTLLTGTAISAALVMPAQAENSFVESLKNGKAQLSFRLRQEDVSQDASGGDLEGTALTVRTRLNYKTADHHGLRFFIEMDNVTELDEVDYNDGVNGKASKAGITDPEGSEVNQLWASYQRGENSATWGRQRIALDNHRFIGTVGWRQNEQTYDGLSFTSKALPDTTIVLAQLNNVNRIFGEDSPAGDVKLDTRVLNVRYSALAAATISGYVYLTDADDKNTAFNSWDNNTWGLRLVGKQTAGDWSYAYSAEYAAQQDAKQNPADYDASYLALEASASYAGVSVTLGQETLGADGSDGYFITPFATLHKFQGWTDKFLGGGKGNQAGGIVDSYASVGTSVSGVKLLAVYHSFDSDDRRAAGGIADMGSEWGVLVATKKLDVDWSLKYASYSEGDSGKGDTDKLWLSASLSF